MTITVFKDEQHLYPVTEQRPLTGVLPTSGGNREVRFHVVLAGEVPAGAFINVSVSGDVLRGREQIFQAAPRLGGSEIPFAALNNATEMSGLVLIAASSGHEGEFPWSLRISVFVSEDSPVETIDVPCVFIRRDYGLPLRFRVLPASRKLNSASPGFRFGEYRWRDAEETNAHTLIPTRWDPDLDKIGREKFIAGIGQANDLELASLEKQRHSIFPRIRHGHYWTGTDRYFCSSDGGVFEIHQATGSGQVISLARTPKRQKPVFVGTFQRDSDGYYDALDRYRYMARGFAAEDPANQFTLDRAGRKIIINNALSSSDVAFAGFAPAAQSATIELPVYPVWDVLSVYVETPQNQCRILEAALQDGSLKVEFPADAAGRKVFISFVRAIAVQYEAEGSEETRLLPIDLNPGFSGIARGHLYLMHRRHRASQITLYADKPRIMIPPTLSSVVSMVAFGPVYYENDYALLLARVTGSNTGEVIPGSRLRVIPGSDFQGFINYADPTGSRVDVVSGGDGTASLIYTPNKGYGFYLDPAESVAGNAVTLPAPVALSQMWNADEGWLISTYLVRDDHPFLGKRNANLSFGEIPFERWNEPGSTKFRTNGLRWLWKADSGVIRPVQAYDADHHPALLNDGTLNPAFTGDAVDLLYQDPLPLNTPGAAANVGAYFLSFIGRVRVQVQDLETGLISNTAMLQLETPPVIHDTSDVAGYLYLDMAEVIKQGRLDANRLGGAPVPQAAFYAPRY